MTEPKFGIRVRDTREDTSVTWRIVGVDEDDISLSGPGPCRSMKTVARAEFEELWEEVEEGS